MIQRFVTFVPFSTTLEGWWVAMGGGVLWVVGCYGWWSAMGGGVLCKSCTTQLNLKSAGL